MQREFGGYLDHHARFMMDTIEEAQNWARVRGHFQAFFLRIFGGNPNFWPQDTALIQIADQRKLQEFFQELEIEFSSHISAEDREQIITIQDAIEWVEFHGKTDEEEADMGMGWREKLTPVQKAFLKISGLLGVILMIAGIQMKVRSIGGSWGEILAGIGAFIGVQMFWGVTKWFNWLEKRKSRLLRLGYHKLFWIVAISLYLFNALAAVVGAWALGAIGINMP
jgi:hypothetical protein